MSFWDDINPVKVAEKVYNDVVKPVWSAGKNAVEDLGAWIDKTVADVIPGGWTTVAEVGLAFTPAGPWASAGLGAASGGTGGFKRSKFDMNGAIMGGISGYGVGSLATSVAGAGAPPPEVGSGGSSWGGNGYSDVPADIPADVPVEAPMDVPTGSSVGDPVDIEPSYAEPNGPLPNNPENIPRSVSEYSDPNSALNRGADASTGASQYMDKLSQAGQGVKNLVGLGPEGLSGIGNAASAVNAGMSTTAYAGLGTTILMDKMSKLEQDHSNGTISDPEYEKQKAELQASIAVSKEAVNKYTYGADSDTSDITPQETLYDTSGENETLYSRNPQQTLYADGGAVDGMAIGGPTMGSGFMFNAGDQAPMYGLGGGVQGYALGGFIPKAVKAAADQAIADKAAADKAAADKAALNKVFSDNPYRDETPMPSVAPVSATPRSTNVPAYEPMHDLGLTLYKQKKLEGLPSYGIGGYAQGGPRFLSGGGDGMSDSIKANIDGHQEARLADGEFVIPADVVSHLGNGSSKAGAKQLYAMMERIRKARTGNPKQGKQINPQKLMPA